jgi:hypothetical protein
MPFLSLEVFPGRNTRRAWLLHADLGLLSLLPSRAMIRTINLEVQMKRPLLASVAALALLAASSSAFAADLTLDEAMLTTEMLTGNFEGPYAGVFGTTYFGVSQYGVGVELGYNLLPSENFLVGAEVSGVAFLTGYDPELWLKGKAGFASDNFAVYGFGEIGAYFPGGAPVVRYGVGGGAEVFVMDSVSLNAEAGLRADIGNPLANPHAQLGLRFHF